MEWPELLRRSAEALRDYTSWLENGCVGEAPAPVDPSGVRGPVPEELRSYASDLVARSAMMERAVTERLTALRGVAGHPSPVRQGYEQRPMPRYLDAMG